MKHNVMETSLGAIVLLVAGLFLTFSYKAANVGAGSGGYSVFADFSEVGGLQTGDDVQISGVKVGAVTDISILPESFLARVNVMVDQSYELPTDTAAIISSEGLLGGRFLALVPGAEEEVLGDGDVIEFTQAPQNLEQLLGQFIFSMQDDGDEN